MLMTEGLAVTGHVFRKAIPEPFSSSSYNHRTSAKAEKSHSCMHHLSTRSEQSWHPGNVTRETGNPCWSQLQQGSLKKLTVPLAHLS